MAKSVMVQLNDEMEAWIEKQCEIVGGMSISSFINIALENYRQQTEMKTRMQDIPGLLQEMSGLLEKSEDVEK